LGTDSAPEQNKMNLNYRNMTNGVVVPNLEANFYPWTAIEFFTIAADRMLRDYSQEWLAENPQAFTNTFGTIITNNFGITNIPVWVDGRFVYTPAIQRVLQLAANIYDATTNNNTAALGTNFPSVFRPTFWVTNENGYTDVYIDGYEQVVSVTGTNDLQLALPVDITDLLLGASIVNYPNGVNVYGVPWIIGAKKGFPNFNEFSMLTLVGIDRKLEITRPSFDASLSLYSTNQMYILSISNSLGVECWNSYATNYFPSPGGLTIVARDNLSMTLSNMDNGTTPAFWSAAPNPANFPLNNAVTIPAGPPGWPGTVPWTITSARPNPNSGSFDIPLMANATFLTNSIYVYPPADSFTPADSDAVNDYVDLGTPALPQFDLVITNRLQVFMLDGNHVIDYVQFVGPDSSTNLNAIIADVPAPPHDSSDAGLWNTNLDNGTPPTPQGVINQILYSTDPRNNGDRLVSKDNGTWRNPPGGGTVADAIAALNAFLDVLDHTGSGGKDLTGDTAPPTLNTNLSVQVPFTPVRYVYGYTSWQANDPLVHYLASDLNFTGVESTGSGSVGLQTGWHPWDNAWRTNAPGTNLRRLNDRYSPWGWSYLGNTNACYNLAYKDPLVRSSDNWDFPTNKFPTVGWLGRVHRGTPWQTVYLKSPPVDSATWTNWTGDFISSGFDATNSMPTRDRLLFDLFTTAFNDNATRGQLSVNVGANDPNNPQAGLAAWSALFSGVEVFSNNVPTSLRFQGTPQYQNPPPSYTNLIINPAGPAGTNSALGQIVAGINQMRASFVNVDGLQGAFEHAGDILATPTLTAHSPFLNWPDAVQRQNGISDEMYEWLPQQAMSLLRVSGAPQSPMRYVIYSYGQALKPAPNSIYTGGGQFFGMVTNYQVVSETATRAVVRFGSTLTNNICFTNSPPTMTNQVINNNAVIESFNVMPPD
jgi:hypothetical protein